MNISDKNKIMSSVGMEPIRHKGIIDNVISKQVNILTYLCCNISYQGQRATDSII